MPTQTRAQEVLRKQEMDHPEIQKVMQHISIGDDITVRFWERRAADLAYLRALAMANVIEISDSDLALAIAIYSSNDWEAPENRVWSFKAGGKFRLSFFEGRMLRAIDYISIG